ncbi:MAG: DUF177 domain-containing protein [Clostridia bacterium]|nr:DUF177 domain-containing protein [Clostridia bacterium]
MKIDLTPILNRRVPVISFDFTVSPESVPEAAEISEEITLTEAISVKGRITDNDGYMKLSAEVSVGYKTFCDRCLAEINDRAEFEFSRFVTLTTAVLEGVDEDEMLVVKEGGIDFDREIIEELSLELPVYHLCEDDCPGLCSVCGKRLDGSCGCEKKKEIDPRMETFKKLLEKMDK